VALHVALEFLDERFARRPAIGQHDCRLDHEAAYLVGRCRHRALHDRGVHDERALDLERTDAVPEHLMTSSLRPTKKLAVRVAPGDVAQVVAVARPPEPSSPGRGSSDQEAGRMLFPEPGHADHAFFAVLADPSVLGDQLDGVERRRLAIDPGWAHPGEVGQEHDALRSVRSPRGWSCRSAPATA